MEGDGPIMGTPKASGVLVMGTNLPAVDATCARLMGVDPCRVAYLAAASGRLGPISEKHIAQRGENARAAGPALPDPRSPQPGVSERIAVLPAEESSYWAHAFNSLRKRNRPPSQCSSRRAFLTVMEKTETMRES